ncbi:MAG: Fe-S assembly protein IscX [Gallionellaceae bacterium CG1_02_60_325]|nr:MAG: Fe-S assembly protein IscX [Gallionellaceae bacterium CG1_02_60_325]
MKWKDVRDIAIALAEKYPAVDPLKVNFVDLHNYVVGLDGFDDDHGHGGEKVLEAIQATWIDETE